MGIGGLGGAGMSLGARAEKYIKPLPSLGGGLLGIQGAFDYYSGDDDVFAGSNSFTVINISATANYHFKMTDTKFDPFFGLGLGFESWSWDGDCVFGGIDYCDGIGSSGIFFVGRLGARYFFSEKMAAYADVGAGAATLNLGIMFKLK